MNTFLVLYFGTLAAFGALFAVAPAVRRLRERIDATEEEMAAIHGWLFDEPHAALPPAPASARWAESVLASIDAEMSNASTRPADVWREPPPRP